MNDPLEPYYKTLDEMKQKGLYTPVRVLESPQGPWFTIDGKKVLNFCSNNYLGLAQDKRLVSAVIKAVKKYGVGPGAVRPISGNLKLHMEAEAALAKFKGAEAAFLLQGGFIGNIVAIQTILGKEDIVISDELNHASIIDAIRLAQIKNKFIYKHLDMTDLERVLNEAKKIQGNHLMLIVTDGVFSMDGDIAPMPDIVRLAKKYGAITMVDDAHGEGVLGQGRGIAHHFKLHGKIDIEVGTLSKAFGVLGGVIAGKKELIEYYRQKGRPYLFSTGLTVADTAAVIEGVKILSRSKSLVKKLWDNAKYLRESFQKLGFNTGSTQTPITPVMLGDENLAKTFSSKLFEHKVFATPIKYPMVPLGKARIRVMPSAGHSKKDLDFGLKIFEKVGKELGVI
ncbi:glycine C-acetyltransferase [Candidatus Gottesmanbacteria bacterium RIFCSPLOWO2_01_FULL_43_11b]|uniref:Glycine C-acetyltransferase n=1 Tax=Candidatus Gottesmanbacteria bacterium RIFCSPLOWO2_01_FULL_43_11b TaxID=1798392 RepID=A0A1F6AGF5_9BACT|nr:MAG: glycine C-acetyltransferase [Candidatus Gottesmanbacteria bacterium RIFCSPLOWO2_01_FULL_43_11b]